MNKINMMQENIVKAIKEAKIRQGTTKKLANLLDMGVKNTLNLKIISPTITLNFW